AATIRARWRARPRGRWPSWRDARFPLSVSLLWPNVGDGSPEPDLNRPYPRGGRGSEAAQPLHRLQQAVVGRGERDPEEPLPVGAVGAARGDDDRGLLEHVLAVLGGGGKARRHRSPDVDRGPGLGHGYPGL